MPIQLPNLDDRNYDQLLRETESLIARYFPEYSDIGPADPAMAVNELFCYLFDVVSYQINRITPETRRNFAALIGIPKNEALSPEESVGLALSKLSRQNRAITPTDIGTLVLEVSKVICSAPVQRVQILPGERVRVYILQPAPKGSAAKRREQEAVRSRDLQRLYSYLRSCSAIGTHLTVEPTPCLDVCIYADVVKRRDSTMTNDSLIAVIQEKIRKYFDPLIGGEAGKGIEYDRPLTKGDVYEQIEGTPGVDYVKTLYIGKTESLEFDKTETADRLTPPEGGLIRLTPRKGEETWVTILGQ